MPRITTGLLTAILLTVVAAGTAYAPYHTSPTPPPSPGQPAPSSFSAAKAQAKVAGTHAGYAAEGGTVGYAKEHLGHTLACIEGASGENVKSSWDNPCQGMGNGVLADLQRSKANDALLEQARSADASAVAGMQSTDLGRIKAAAKQVSTLMLQIARAK